MKTRYPLFIVLLIAGFAASAQVPQTLSYQGLLTKADGSPVPDTPSKTIVFNFYTSATGGTAQQRTVTGVNTFQGLFTTIIGNGAANSANAPLNNLMPPLGSQQYYIGLQVDGGTELSPRVALTAVPYAFVASSLDANATVSATQLTGTVPTERIAPSSIDDSKLVGISASKVTGNLPAAQISGTLTTAQHADGSITNAKLALGAVTDAKITGPVSLANGGTGAATAGSARINLGLGSLATLSAVTGTEITDGSVTNAKITGPISLANGGTAAANAADARTNLGVAIGTNVQASNANLDDLADGSLTGSKIGAGIDATKITTNAVAIVNGGTGATTAVAARTNLGVAIGTNVQAYNSNLDDLADGSLTGSKIGVGISANNITSGTLPVDQLPATVGFTATRTATGTVSSQICCPITVQILLGWDNPQYNVGNGFNPASGLFTAPSNGWYSFIAQLGFIDGTTQGVMYPYFQAGRNGVLYQSWYIPGFSSYPGSTRIIGSIHAYLLAGDTMGVYFAQSTGASISYSGDGSAFFFQGVRIGN